MFIYRQLWNWVDKIDLKKKYKQNLFLLLCTLLCAVLSTILWFAFGKGVFGNSVKSMLCFIGYPSIILGFLCGILFLFKLDQK